jgi:hypothetical protein
VILTEINPNIRSSALSCSSFYQHQFQKLFIFKTKERQIDMDSDVVYFIDDDNESLS